MLVVLLPVPPKYHFTGHGKTTARKEQQCQKRADLRNAFEHIFYCRDVFFNTGKLKLCVASWKWQC
jgi:hypothetical protein